MNTMRTHTKCTQNGQSRKSMERQSNRQFETDMMNPTGLFSLRSVSPCSTISTAPSTPRLEGAVANPPGDSKSKAKALDRECSRRSVAKTVLPTEKQSGFSGVPNAAYQSGVGRKSKKPSSNNHKYAPASVVDINICGVYSRGSKNHHKGQCRPCVKVNLPSGCPDGEFCNFCHYIHDDAHIQQHLPMNALQAFHGAECEKPKEKKDVLDEPWYVPMPQSLVGPREFGPPPGLLPPSKFATYEHPLPMGDDPLFVGC